jgi:hypothetical protein
LAFRRSWPPEPAERPLQVHHYEETKAILTTVVFAYKSADGEIQARIRENKVSLTMHFMKYIMNRTNE